MPQQGERAEYGFLLVDSGWGQLELLTDDEDGLVDLTVEVHDEPPPASPETWQESVTAVVRWERVTTARIRQLDVDLAEEWEVVLPAPHFVFRAHRLPDGERERWLLRLWPATDWTQAYSSAAWPAT
ncbi:hypothetical protein [Saccharothrix algeriensis]|uniref:Uncharacterized protein n=1 Tax=Saccharothrix algeriensis TaxID=173560 RepID=A0ABS2SE68_9PSEU|nr:hypothetical protein [Saccharothrix algeriensis]MBM7814562.1 hypothetical protein [Saccharothrix algeriensis]